MSIVPHWAWCPGLPGAEAKRAVKKSVKTDKEAYTDSLVKEAENDVAH